MQEPWMEKFETWRSRLLDLTRRNRLLYFKPNRRTVQITEPGLARLFADLVLHDRRLRFPHELGDLPLMLTEESEPSRSNSAARVIPGDVTTRPEAKQLSRVLYKLRLEAQLSLSERGINTLFLMLGMLHWQESSSSSDVSKSPLLLIPVSLERKEGTHAFFMKRFDDDVVVNPTLAFKLRNDFGFELPNLDEDAENVSLVSWLKRVQVAARSMGWNLVEEAWLAPMSFLKLSMYRDLEDYRPEIGQHPVVDALAGQRALPAPDIQAPGAEEMDQRDPAEYFPVLDADSSQLEAIAHARAGHNLVVDGPPGTGKSQTIANIIADLLNAGKRVLFVSEKMAALEVVHRRLKDAGLGDFCLEVHSHRANKRDVLDQMGSSLEGGDTLPARYQATAGFAELKQQRDELNSYVRALHMPRGIQGRTAFQVHGLPARMGETAPLPTPLHFGGVLSVSAADEQRLLSIVRRITARGDLLQEYATHPWRDSIITSYSLTLQDRLSAELLSFRKLVESLPSLQMRLAERCGLDYAPTLEGAECLLGATRLVIGSPGTPESWLVGADLQPLLDSAQSYHHRFNAWHEAREDLLRYYSPQLFALDCSDLAQCFGTRNASALAVFDRNSDTAMDAAIRGRFTIEPQLDTIQALLGHLPSDLRELAELCGVAAPNSLAEADIVCRTAMLVAEDPRPRPDWLTWQSLRNLRVLAEDAECERSNRLHLHAALMESFKSGILQLSGAEWLRRFGEQYKGLFVGLKGDFRRDRAALENLLHQTRKLSRSEAIPYLQQLAEYQDLSKRANERRAELAGTFGPHFQDDGTDWEAVRRSLDTIQQILQLHGDRLLSETLGDVLVQSGARIRAIRARINDVTENLDQLRTTLQHLQATVSLGRICPGALVIENAPLPDLAASIGLFCHQLQSLWRAYDGVQPALQIGVTRSPQEMAEDVRRSAQLQALENEVATDREALTARYGEFFQGMGTRWQQVMDALTWTARSKAHFGSEAVPPGFVQAVVYGSEVPCDIRADHQELERLLERLPAECAGLWEIFPSEVLEIEGTPFRSSNLGAVARWLDDHQRATPRLREWVDFVELRNECERHGLGSFLGMLVEKKLPAAAIDNIFQRIWLTSWLDEAYSSSTELKRFHRGEHEQLLDRFRELDSGLRSAVSDEIAAQLLRRRPASHRATSLVASSELGVLTHELRKKKRHMPLRKLFSRIPHLLLDLKPCLLMSPLSVAYYLPKDSFEFDTVIFDEASQIPPEDAIGAMLRARQVIVAGDDKQLPPTSFFTADDDFGADEEDERFDVLESILDECASLPNMQRGGLRWHYRSRNETLIAFSNAAFYRNRLLTFPSPATGESREGVSFEFVADGVWDRGRSRTNIPEARRVATLVTQHLERWGTGKSLGVITLNQSQADRIRDELTIGLREHTELAALLLESGHEPFFIKSLENVQGDERASIILSVGYGPDTNGVVALNFGPINRDGGERRLNVAVTRAKWDLTLVSSMQPEQMDLARLNRTNRGVELLQQYLYYARDGRVPVESVPIDRDPDSPFEEAVRDAIKASGLSVDPQVGCSGFRIDLGIRHPDRPERYILGVECDGATYHSAKTARDRDRLRQEVLEGLGWDLIRIWSTDWVRNPTGELQRVFEKVEDLRLKPLVEEHKVAHTHPEAIIPLQAPAPEGWNSPAESEGANPADSIYRPTVFQNTRHPDWLYYGEPADIAPDVIQVVHAEGPIHGELLVQRIARRYGLWRTGDRIQEYVERAITLALRQRQIEQRGAFFWPSNPATLVPRQPASDGEPRPPQFIAPEEIEAAARLLIEDNYPMPREALIKETARWLGFKRVGPNVDAAIRKALASLDDVEASAG